MKIKKFTVKRFSVFEEAILNFCDGINVFIGTNATGKSHIMKAMYCLMRASKDAPWQTPNVAMSFRVQLLNKLANVFRPQEDSVGRLVKRSVGVTSGKADLVLTGEGKHGACGFTINTRGGLTQRRTEGVTGAERSLFIPSREVLSFHSSLISAYESVNLRFDETYYDLAKALAAPTLLGPRAQQAAQLVKPLEAVLGGKVYEAKDGSLHLKNKHGDFEPHLLSEGWRKLASLVRLMLNGNLMANGFLFWDEPEANLNPELTVVVAKMLRLLAAKGVQIVISTHDYLLSRHLSLAAEYPAQMPSGEQCAIKFFGFARQNGSVGVSEAGTLSQLPSNPILNEFAALYDREGDLLEKQLTDK